MMRYRREAEIALVSASQISAIVAQIRGLDDVASKVETE
jgi:hypothetical protein